MDIQGERAGFNPALSPYVAYVQYVQKNISKYIIHDLVSQSRVTARGHSSRPLTDWTQPD